MLVSREQEALVFQQGDETQIPYVFIGQQNTRRLPADNSRGNRKTNLVKDSGVVELSQKIGATFQQDGFEPFPFDDIHQLGRIDDVFTGLDDLDAVFLDSTSGISGSAAGGDDHRVGSRYSGLLQKSPARCPAGH